jgi:hypothetical protein
MHNLGGCLNVPWASDPRCEQPKELSSWFEKMETLIRKLNELETAASRGHQPQLGGQVKALRTAIKGQQDRCITFLQLTEEYSEKFLTDVEGEIQQQAKQKEFLDALNNLLDDARELRKTVHQLRKSYEVGMGLITVQNIQKTCTCPTYRLPTLRRIVETCISSSARTTERRRCQLFQGYPEKDSTAPRRHGQVLGR